MSNILKISTPISGYENNVSKQDPQMKNDVGIKNPVNPDKVVRADSRAEYGNERGVQQGLSYESNFGNFVRTLANIPRASEIMSKMLFSGMRNVIEAGIGTGMAEEIHMLLGMLEMDPQKLKEFLKSQMNGSNKMKGSLFELLRGVMKEAGSVELKAGILDFLKKYNDMSSGKHIMTNIKGELKEIESYMFRNERAGLQRLTQQLLPHSQENMEQNIKLLKSDIIPFLGNYISETRNLGKIRDLINLLTFNTSRYENGNLDGVVDAFKRLSDFPAFRRHFASMDRAEIRELFRNIDFDRAAGKEEWSEQFLSLLRMGAEGKAGIENKVLFPALFSYRARIKDLRRVPFYYFFLPLFCLHRNRGNFIHDFFYKLFVVQRWIGTWSMIIDAKSVSGRFCDRYAGTDLRMEDTGTNLFGDIFRHLFDLSCKKRTSVVFGKNQTKYVQGWIELFAHGIDGFFQLGKS